MVKLCQLHLSEGKYNTGGKRDRALEKTLIQASPERDWVNAHRLPNLYALKYASQLTERWPDFEKNQLPKIFQWLNKHIKAGSYAYRRVVEPATKYIENYCNNTGYAPPPDSQWLSSKSTKAVYHRATKVIVMALNALGHHEISKDFAALYSLTSDLAKGRTINATKDFVDAIADCEKSISNDGDERKWAHHLAESAYALFTHIIRSTDGEVKGEIYQIKKRLQKEMQDLFGKKDLPAIPNNNRRALAKHRQNKWKNNEAKPNP